MAPDDNHHLWRNGRYWWVAFVVVIDGVRQVRIRESLKTEDVNTARERRDACIREYASRAGCVVPLRMERRKSGDRSIHLSNDSLRPASERRIT